MSTTPNHAGSALAAVQLYGTTVGIAGIYITMKVVLKTSIATINYRDGLTDKLQYFTLSTEFVLIIFF